MIFHSDLLHAQVLLSRDGKPGPGFDRLVIRYYYTLPVADVSDTRYRAAGRASSLFFIHVISGKSADLDKRASFIDEVADAFSRGELILFPLLVNRFFPTPQCDLVQPGSHLAERPLHGIFIFIKIYIHGKQFNYLANAGTVNCPSFGSNDGPIGQNASGVLVRNLTWMI